MNLDFYDSTGIYLFWKKVTKIHYKYKEVYCVLRKKQVIFSEKC